MHIFGEFDGGLANAGYVIPDLPPDRDIN